MPFSRWKLVLPLCCSLLGMAAEALAQSPAVLAEASMPERQSWFVWFIQCLGLFGLLIVLSAPLIFLGALLVVILARRPAVIASYLVFPLLPLLLGVLGAMKGCVSAFSELARSGVDIKAAYIAAGVSEALILPLTALMLTFPTFVVLAIGLFIRTLLDKPPTR